jgi:4-hydroxy-3-polyprenylbenzoate decarboxylase
MAYRDYQDFLDKLRAAGELKTISVPVSPYLEITEIADRVMKADGPALLFDQVVGPAPRLGTPDPMSAVMRHPSIDPLARPESPPHRFDYPVAINAMGSRKRMAMALSCDDFDEHADRLRKLVQAPGNMPKSLGDKLKFALEMGGEVKTVGPKEVSQGMCQEIVWQGDEIDLTKLPILTCWPEDGGPFVTLPLVFTHDPNTGKRNVGMYRVQVFDRNTCGMHWQMHKTGMRQMEDAGSTGQ